MARKTLDEMARGGMYDQVGGGFHRYSVDERWLVPHFEKMLYDNAQLARVYLEGIQVTGEPFYGAVAAEILDYVLREMTVARGRLLLRDRRRLRGRGGPVLRLDARARSSAVLGDEDAAGVFCAYYDVTSAGNWEGHSIPNTSRTGPRVAQSPRAGRRDELERDVAALAGAALRGAPARACRPASTTRS